MPLTLDGSGTIGGVTDFSSSNIELTDPKITGGVYLGGTGSANKLDDYEEGTWTPTTSGASLTVNQAHYIKIGKTVFAQAFVGVSSSSPDGANFTLPFTPDSYYWPGSFLSNAGVEGVSRVNPAGGVSIYSQTDDSSISYSNFDGHFIMVTVTYFIP